MLYFTYSEPVSYTHLDVYKRQEHSRQAGFNFIPARYDPTEDCMPYMKDVLGLILGGGQGTRLYPLTKERSKPAVPLAGKYRLIDIPMSNCFHADIEKIAILTQFNSASLHRHIWSCLLYTSRCV